MQRQGLDRKVQLAALEEVGAPVDVLVAAVDLTYTPESRWPLYCCGICCEGDPDEKEGLSREERLARCSWATAVLQNPGPVIDASGFSLQDVFAHRVAHLEPSRWLEGQIEQGLEPEVVLAVHEHGQCFLTPIAPVVPDHLVSR
jgi:hypothetical protein